MVASLVLEVFDEADMTRQKGKEASPFMATERASSSVRILEVVLWLRNLSCQCRAPRAPLF